MQLYKLLKKLSCDIYECKRLAELDGTCEQCDRTKSCKSYLAIHVNINNSIALHKSRCNKFERSDLLDIKRLAPDFRTYYPIFELNVQLSSKSGY